MSKPFLASVVRSPSVSLEGTEIHLKTSTGQVAVDLTDVGGFKASTSGAPFLAQVAPNNAIELLGTDIFVFAPGGNVVVSASQLVETAESMRQPMLTNNEVAVVSPSDPDYVELSDVQAVGLAGGSRLVLVPGLGGTIIRSLFSTFGSPNAGGREILVMNGGVGNIVLPSGDPTGTAGGRFTTPGSVDFAIRPGGGAWISFEPSVGSDGGCWVVAAP